MQKFASVSFRAIVAGCALLAGFSASGVRVTELPENLADLTDDLDNRASVSASAGNLIGSAEHAFDNDHLDPELSVAERQNCRFGGNRGTPTEAFAVELNYTFSEARIVNAFRIFNSCDAHQMTERAPKAFQLRARNRDDEEWIVLDSESDQTGWGAMEGRYFEFPNLRAFTQYSLLFTASNGGGYTTIQEAELFGHEQPEQLLIDGDPVIVGEPNPNYGALAIAAGASATLTMVRHSVLDENNRLQLSGWEIYAYDAARAAWAATPESANPQPLAFSAEGIASVEYVHPSPARQRRFVWKFIQSSKIAFAANDSARGAIEAVGLDAEGFADSSTPVTLTATPSAGYRFSVWKGDVGGIDNLTSPTIVFAGGTARNLTAVFVRADAQGTIFVSPDGDDANTGFSAATPKRTLAAAAAYLKENWEGSRATIFLADGEHRVAEAAGIDLSFPVLVTSLSGNASATVIRNTKTADWNDGRCLLLNHPEAEVSWVTVADGQIWISADGGACILVGPDGGTVAHCIVENGKAFVNKIKCAGVALQGGRITHTRIRNCSRTAQAGSVAIALCLSGNAQASDVEISGIDCAFGNVVCAADTSVAANLTITGCKISSANSVLSTSVYLLDGSGTFRNVVVAVCTVSGDESGAAAAACAGDLNNCLNCATDADDAAGTLAAKGWKIASAAAMFANPAGGDFRPLAGGPLMDGGNADGLQLSAVDLAGKPRVVGKCIDIGAWECQAMRGLMLMIK